MSPYISWIVSILYNGTVLKCALSVHRDVLKGDCAEYPLEPENREQIHSLLPKHVQSCGKVIDVEEIFDVHTVDKENT